MTSSHCRLKQPFPKNHAQVCPVCCLDILERANGSLENGAPKKNGEVIAGKAIFGEQWKNLSVTVYSRASRAYPGHWPIPEDFWPDRSM